MINTAKYLEDSVAFITDRDLENLHEDFIYQERYLVSKDFNFTLNNMEAHLTELYEKARSLQDVITYAKEYVKQNIYSITDECKSILSSIEDNVDSLVSKNYITTTVSFEESTGSYLDRDNKLLPSCAQYDGNLTLSGRENSRLKIKSIKHKNGFTPYRHNLNDLKQETGSYRSFYILDAPVKNGLKEEIELDFENPDTINHLNITASNCKVTGVKYFNTNGTVDNIEDHNNLFQCDRLVKSISFVTTTDNYKVTTYYVDNARIKPNFWDAIKEDEYNKTIGKASNLTQAQIDELSGFNAFKQEYKDYTEKVQDWISRRESILKQNIANGYKDAMPTIDFIVAPESLGVIMPGVKETSTTTVASTNTTTNARAIIVKNENIIDKDKFYPTIDNAKYQAEYLSQYDSKKYLNKTGEEIDLYYQAGKSQDYTKSYKR